MTVGTYIETSGETYIVNRRTGTTHIAIDGRTPESCNVDQIIERREVGTLEELGSTTRKPIRFCKRCAPETIR